jgi:hypothetical protein
MRPLAVLLGIVMGSTVSIAVGLALTLVVFALLPDHTERVGEEVGPLWRTFTVMLVAAAVAAMSFLGELRLRPWRHLAHAALLAMLGAVVWLYWPR